MADSPYLVALALIEQDGRRSLPLTGKSQPAAAAAASDPGETGRSLALELLLRIWQRSDDGPLRRACGARDIGRDLLPVLTGQGDFLSHAFVFPRQARPASRASAAQA